MRVIGRVWIVAAILLASAAFAGSPSFDGRLNLPPYSAPHPRSTPAAAALPEDFDDEPALLNRLTVDAQERQCRRDLFYVAQARGASQTEILLQRKPGTQSAYDLPGFDYIPYCLWYPQWRLRGLFGPRGGPSHGSATSASP